MGDLVRTPAQSYPAAGVLTDLYAVPQGKSAVVGSIHACNHSSSDDSVRVSIASGGGPDDPKHYIYFDLVVSALSTFLATYGGTLAAGDVIRCLSRNGTTSFNASLIEVT